MAKKIIFILIALIILATTFFASYTLSLKYWDKLAPYVGGGTERQAAPAESTEAESETETETAAVTAAATPTQAAEPATLPDGTEANIVEMPADDSWMLVVLNRRNRLAKGYEPTLAPAVAGSTVQLDARVAEAFGKMYEAARADGIALTPVSGYVSTELQETLYNKKVEEFMAQGVTPTASAQLAAEEVLPAGCSEDNAGLSVSIGMLLDSFTQQDAYQWLKEHAAEYGFIERYTADKKLITEVSARPWYWRYVGPEAAREISASGVCLEEHVR